MTTDLRSVPADRVLDLGLGDPAHPMPPVVSDVLRKLADRPSLGYAPPGGLPVLRRELAEKLVRVNHLDADGRGVVVTNGASQAIAATLAAVCAPGSTVLLPEPGYPAYRAVCRSLGLRTVGYRVDEAGPDWDVLERAASGAAVLVWNFPANPTGMVADPAWYPRLYALLEAHRQLTVVSDEVYEELCFDAAHRSPAAGAGASADRFVSVFSFSKGHAMTGFRVGYAHAHADLAARIARTHYALSMSVSTVSQLCALAVLRAGDEHPAGHRAALLAGRDRLVTGLRAAGLRVETPQAGCFVWPDVSASGLDAETWCRTLALRLRVLASPGTEFGAQSGSRARLSFAVPAEDLAEAVRRIGSWAAAGWSADHAPADHAPAAQGGVR
ncbi:pyridoxal phosphate-dependent aminotransferase [Kitasatospora sp. NPDC093558]|uniref:pyridoxal phosphate-dependent aminotransferase n=1 Tax=Kitasatospora sp. NPDC093558 TaxID=3155201 RepID=UPI0034489F2C